MLPECSLRLEMRALGGISLVLDASESAWKYQRAVLELASGLLEKLPAGMARRLFFLGNSAEYDSAGFARHGAAWWRENSTRASLIRRVAEKVGDTRMVIIGSGTIYDLEDWADTVGSGLILANVGDASLRGGVAVGRELERPELADLLSLAHDPIESIEIGGKDFMPYYWSNPEYRLAAGERILRAIRPQSPAVTLACWGQEVVARIQRSASREEVALEPANPEPEAGWLPLSPEEAGIALEAIAGSRFTCPLCHKQHPPATLRCSDGSSILGEPLYPSLAGRKGFVLLRVQGRSVLYRFHPVSALRLGDCRAALALGGGARIYEYEPSRGWADAAELAPYYPAEGGFALAL